MDPHTLLLYLRAQDPRAANHVIAAYRSCGGNETLTAKHLGLHRRTLQRAIVAWPLLHEQVHRVKLPRAEVARNAGRASWASGRGGLHARRSKS